MGRVWSTHVKTNFMVSLPWIGFFQHVICILCAPWHVRSSVDACWDNFCLRWHGKGLVITCSSTFGVLAGMGCVWSTHVNILLMSSQALVRFNHHELGSILCIPYHWMSLVITWYDAFCVLAGMGGFWSAHVEIHLCSRWNWLGLASHVEINFLCSLACD